MRWLGAVMIVVGCGMMGYLSSSTLARRTAALRSFVDGLTLLRSEIVDGRTPLPEAAALCARRCTGASARFFTAFCRELAGVQDLAGWYGQILHGLNGTCFQKTSCCWNRWAPCWAATTGPCRQRPSRPAANACSKTGNGPGKSSSAADAFKEPPGFAAGSPWLS